MEIKRGDLRQAIFEKELAEKMDATAGPEHRKASVLFQKAKVRHDVVRKAALNYMEDFALKHRSRFAGLVQDRESLPDIVRALVGEPTKNTDANAFGESIRAGMDYLHKRYKAARIVTGKPRSMLKCKILHVI